MFTGIITDLGSLAARTTLPMGLRLTIYSHYPAETIKIGASIACNGVCLTVVAVDSLAPNSAFTTAFQVEVWQEALRLTTISEWAIGDKINLERSLTLGAELGGHFVLGHVHGCCEILDIKAEGSAKRFILKAPAEFIPYLVPKGSIALDGTSLTINHSEGGHFDVLLIDHTLKVTNWDSKTIGERVNAEFDQLVCYNMHLSGSLTKTQSKSFAASEQREARFLIIDARFYEDISEKLFQGAVNILHHHKATYDHVLVPGALEIPAVVAMAEKAKKNYAGYIALGCIIRGETYHFDIVANESARALMDLSIKGPLAIGNGIITVENRAQALARCKDDSTNKGACAAKAAIKMSSLSQKFCRLF